MPDVCVRADLHMLQSVVLNIVNNALQAMSEKRKDGAKLTIRGDVQDGRAWLVFDDDGPGLPDPDQIFEPFFTTKPPGEGTGLGLAVAHRFMEAFGGRITGRNRVDGGARFTLEFEAVEAVAAATRVPDSIRTPGPEPPAGLRVLVVEDEEPLRRLQERILSRIEAEVFTAADGAEARELLQTRDVDLIVSDVRMPGESGLDLYRWVRRERPRLSRRFLFVTGDIGAPELAALAHDRPGYLLHKPFEVEEYLARVRRIMQDDPEGPGDSLSRSHSSEARGRPAARGAASEPPESAPESS